MNLDLLIPNNEPERNRWTWATVTQLDPLRIRLDGDSAALDLTPDSLVDHLTVGQRVWVQTSGRRVVVVGASGGTDPVIPQPVYPDPVTSILGSLSVASGWTLQSARYVKFGPFVDVLIGCTRTGSDIVVGSGGNVSPDLLICTGFPSSLRPTNAVPGTLWRPAIQSATASLGSGGAVEVTDGSPSMTLPGSGTVYHVRFTYALGL